MSVLNIGAIKSRIKTIFDNNNTTTSSIQDLSDGMVNRVAKVLKINPELIPVQPSFYPCVTMHLERKDVVLKTIAPTQLAAKRQSDIFIKVTGIVWNSNLTSDVEDPAMEDLDNLMENVEEILRSDPTLNGNVQWTATDGVSYQVLPIGEETHMRGGQLDLRIRTYY